MVRLRVAPLPFILGSGELFRSESFIKLLDFQLFHRFLENVNQSSVLKLNFILKVSMGSVGGGRGGVYVLEFGICIGCCPRMQ